MLITKELLSGNLLYNTYIDRWRYLYRSFVGGLEYRDAGYLTRYQLETNIEYAARCAATPLDNQCKSVISVYNSFLFRESPDRDFAEYNESPLLEDFLQDADLEGRSLDNFMKEVSTWSQVFGHTWIIMSKPNVGATTLADEQAMGVRPYVSLLTPLVVLDWAWKRSVDGRYELEYLRYVEEMNGSVQTIKEWTKTEIRTHIIDIDHETVDDTTIEVNGLGIIPAVISYSDRSIVRGIGVSAIDDIADMQRYIYNALSEADQSIRLDSHPSLVKTSDTEVGTGAGSIITIPDNLPPSANPYILDFNGASIDSIYTVINNTVNSIEKISNIGSIRATEGKVMSGVAMQTEFQLLNSRLSSIADNLELAEEQMWKLWCQYQGIAYDFEIEYPGSFAIHDTDNEIQQLQTAKSAATDPRILAAIDAKILEWLDLDEDEVTATMNVVLPETADTETTVIQNDK